jgi:ureidoglycolate lyase
VTAQGWRPVDKNSGDHGGVTEGLFEFWWKGEVLHARNNAVGGSDLLGWSNWPEHAVETEHTGERATAR